MKMKQENISKKFYLKKMFIIFIIGSILGTFYEEILNIIIHGFWESRHTVLYGPFNPIYGIGIMLIIIILDKNNNSRNFFITWIYSSFIGGLFEYLLGFFIDKIFEIKFWDYSNYFLNINGYTTIYYVIGWGLAGAIFMKFIYPKIKIEKIIIKINNLLFIIITIFILLDIAITYSALGRMTLRNHNIKPYTFIGKLYDNVYTDEYIIKQIPVIKQKKT